MEISIKIDSIEELRQLRQEIATWYPAPALKNTVPTLNPPEITIEGKPQDIGEAVRNEIQRIRAELKPPVIKEIGRTLELPKDFVAPIHYAEPPKREVVIKPKISPDGFPKIWEDKALIKIANRERFTIKDVTGNNHNETHKSAFSKWCQTHPQLEAVRTEGIGRPWLFLPTWFENGIKQVAKMPPPKSHNYIKAAGPVRQIIRESEQEKRLEEELY